MGGGTTCLVLGCFLFSLALSSILFSELLFSQMCTIHRVPVPRSLGDAATVYGTRSLGS